MGKRILVVEDDAQNSYLIGFILEKSGYEVVTATDGEQAVAAVELAAPDLILMDMLLPKMNGYEATRAIKADPATVGIPIIALTAYSMKGDREKILEAGCDGYISKPIDPETFVSQMEEFFTAS
ncbi:MAG: response regulator [Coriobacteriia bacterium]|nr:response regulator [Coriobacteriia bacterium]